MVVHEREEAHDELAVHPVSDTTVARNGLAKVLDLESALETGSKESTERSDQRSESGEGQDVELNGFHPEGLVQAKDFKRVRLRREDRVWDTFKTGQSIRAEVVDGTDEVLVTDQQVGHEITKGNGAGPCAEESLNSLLRGELNKLCPSKANTANIGEDIIGDDQRSGKEEPDHALENVVHDKVSLNNNQIQSHMGPSKLGELESVVALLQRSDKEDESYQRGLAE